jgi:hypothetical protein
VRYVPDLAESIYSLFLHIQCPCHGLHSSFEDGLFIVFPEFKTKALLGNDDIYLDAVPYNCDNICHNSIVPPTSDPPSQLTTDTFCRNVKRFDDEVHHECKSLDNLLKTLRQYYKEVKTKRQLSLDVPASFRKSSELQKQYQVLTPPRKSTVEPITNSVTTTDGSSTQHLPMDNSSHMSTIIDNNPITNNSSTVSVPILRCVNKPSSSLPSRLTFTEDIIRASVGFRRIDTIKTHLKNLYQDTICLDSTPTDAVLDEGDLSTIRKTPRNTTPITRPASFGEVIHMDIVFGPDISIGNIHYGLLFTDRFSRMTYIYPLQKLATDIKKQMESFFAHLGFSPKRLISDFDTKLIGGKAREYLNSLHIHLNAAPANRQDKNGLAERHWQTMIAMARNWLASAELPSKFWYFAVKRAAEICNYFPIKVDNGEWTTPFMLAHKVKPDLRVLFKLFSVAAVRRERHGDVSLGKFESQSIPMIAVGRCSNSNGIQFYNPANGKFVSSIDYKFQLNVTSGAYFGLKYQPGVFIYRIDESSSVFSPTYALDSSVYVHTHSPPSVAKVVGIPTYNTPNIYTVAFKDGSISEYTDDLLSATPDIS